MKHYEWSEGKVLADNLSDMGFVEPSMSFRKRFLLAEYLDQYLEKRDREREESKRMDPAFWRKHSETTDG